MPGKRLGRAYREGRLDRRMRVYLAPEVLVIDEVGYLQLDDRRNGEFSSALTLVSNAANPPAELFELW